MKRFVFGMTICFLCLFCCTAETYAGNIVGARNQVQELRDDVDMLIMLVSDMEKVYEELKEELRQYKYDHP
ncbi:MAG: hypothetical protein NUV86_09745 [Candidatus Scalindua sp.]|nr:hypothetical protein [Candidatus Scalindua sp.]MCR4343944.1 hypothetical protein [Candidatus Scalindua sp.]